MLVERLSPEMQRDKYADMFPNRNANRQTMERLSMRNVDRKVSRQSCQAECR